MEQLENSEKKAFCFHHMCFLEDTTSNDQNIFYLEFKNVSTRH